MEPTEAGLWALGITFKPNNQLRMKHFEVVPQLFGKVFLGTWACAPRPLGLDYDPEGLLRDALCNVQAAPKRLSLPLAMSVSCKAFKT